MGMATAIVINATLVRGILLPASITLFGERVWTLPRLRALRGRSPQRVASAP
ncbi:hypothetical protein OG900_08910 [Streptomyces sp. NBC_00433]